MNSSSTDTDHNLDNLPEDIYLFYLFKFLDLDDVWMLRLISRRLYSIVKVYNINELYFVPREFYQNVSYNFKDSWFSTTKRIKTSNQLEMSKLGLLVNPSNNLLGLKHLKMKVCPIVFKLECLNKFTKLQNLEINGLQLNCNSRLQLPELKTLSIHFAKDSNRLDIDTPTLQELQINSLFQDKLIDNEIKFENFLSIKHLKAVKLDRSLHVFQNLECLEMGSDDNSPLNIQVDNLLKFNKLKKLRINSYLYGVDFDRLKELHDLKREDLKIVVVGVKVQAINKFDEYRKTEALEFQIKNYGELEDDLNFITLMQYDKLIRLMPYYQPTDLFRKYNDIQLMKIDSKIEDENQLIKFITKCDNLYHLEIRNSSLIQNFYDKLPSISSLSKLLIDEKRVDLNFIFLMKMQYLKGFITNQDILLDENLCLNGLKYLGLFEFRIRHLGDYREMTVYKKGRDKYESEDMLCCLNLSYQRYFLFKEIISLSRQIRDA